MSLHVLTYVLMSQDFTSFKKLQTTRENSNSQIKYTQIKKYKRSNIFLLFFGHHRTEFIFFRLFYFISIKIFQLEKTTLCPLSMHNICQERQITCCWFPVKPIWTKISFVLNSYLFCKFLYVFFCAGKQQKYLIFLVDEDFIPYFLSVTMLMMKLLMVTMMMKCWQLWTFQEGTLLPIGH